MSRKISNQKVVIQAHDTGEVLYNVRRTVTLVADDGHVMGGFVKVNGASYSVEKKPGDTTWYSIL